MANPLKFGNGKTHGLIDPGDKVWADRHSTACHIMHCLDERPEPRAFAFLRGATLLWREIMTAIMRQNSADWFLTSAMLGHPTPQQCRREVTALSILSEAAALNDPFAIRYSIAALRKTQFGDRLDRFLELMRSEDEVPLQVASDWLYLMQTGEEWGVVNLGTIEGHLEQAVAEMDDLNPELAPYGIAGAWRVKDSRRGYNIAARVLKKAYIQPDFYEFNSAESLDAMKTAISRNLSDRGQLIDTVGDTSADWNHKTLSEGHNDSSAIEQEEDEHDLGMSP